MSYATLQTLRPSVARVRWAFLALFATLLAVGAPSHAANGEPIIGPPLRVVQDAYIKASNTDERDNFGSQGTTIAYANGLLVVGVQFEDSGDPGDPDDNSDSSSGAAYVYSRANGSWQFEAYLKAPDPTAVSLFGTSVATDGTTIVVGAPRGGDDDAGRAFVFTDDWGGWTLQAALAPSEGDGEDNFGATVAVSGNLVAVGAPQDDGIDNSEPTSGAVYIFEGPWTGFSQEVWEAYSFAADDTVMGDLFGGSLAMSENLLVVGATGEDSGSAGVGGDPYDETGNRNGAAYVFQIGAGVEDLHGVAFLKASNPDLHDRFGQSVAISGTTVVVGTVHEASSSTGIDSDGNDNSLLQAGAAYVFDLVDGEWQQVAYLKPNDIDYMEHFAASVGVYGDFVVVGAPHEDSSTTGSWVAGQDELSDNSGAVYVFHRGSSGNWYHYEFVKASNTDNRDEFGSALAIHGDTFVVGAPGEDSSAILIDGSQDNDISTGGDQGAAYAFVFP